MKTNIKIERIIKGVANHRRVQLVKEIGNNPEQSVEEIAEKLEIDYRTVSSHLNRLAIAGLVMKRHEGHSVRLRLTNRGSQILKFLRTLE